MTDCWVCDWGFVHVKVDVEELILARGTYWIDDGFAHPFVIMRERTLRYVDEFLSLGLYYSKEFGEQPPNLLTAWILDLKREERSNHVIEPLGCALAEVIKLRWHDLNNIIIVPSPKHPEEKGGYNQAAALAREVGNRLGLKVVEDLVIKSEPTPTSDIRRRCREGVGDGGDLYNCVLSELMRIISINKGRLRKLDAGGALIIDDVRTTGATLDAVAKALKDAGFGRVYAAVLGRDAVRNYLRINPRHLEGHEYYQYYDNYEQLFNEPGKYYAITDHWDEVKVKMASSITAAKQVLSGKRLGQIIEGLVNMGEVRRIAIEEYGEKLGGYDFRKVGITPVPMDSLEYPELLLNYGKGNVYPPPILYRVGKPLRRDLVAVAIAGSRDPSGEGRRLAREVARRIVKELGLPIITGLASGVDEEAFNGAVDAGGHVIGVRPYILEIKQSKDATLYGFEGITSKALEAYDNITIISEHLVKPNSENEIRSWLAIRNRITDGMSIAVVIPETRKRRGGGKGWGGTRRHVEYGIEMGRTVIVMKPRVNDAGIKGGYEYFIRMGAKSVESVDDVLRIIEDEFKKLKERRRSKGGVGDGIRHWLA